MLQSEFDRLTSRPYTEAEFSEIHYEIGRAHV